MTKSQVIRTHIIGEKYAEKEKGHISKMTKSQVTKTHIIEEKYAEKERGNIS